MGARVQRVFVGLHHGLQAIERSVGQLTLFACHWPVSYTYICNADGKSLRGIWRVGVARRGNVPDICVLLGFRYAYRLVRVAPRPAASWRSHSRTPKIKLEDSSSNPIYRPEHLLSGDWYGAAVRRVSGGVGEERPTQMY
jgi:hypothetical protein